MIIKHKYRFIHDLQGPFISEAALHILVKIIYHLTTN